MLSAPSDLTRTMINDINFMSEVNRLAGIKAELLHGWIGQDIFFLTVKDGNRLVFMNLRLTEQDKYQGCIDNIMYIQ